MERIADLSGMEQQFRMAQVRKKEAKFLPFPDRTGGPGGTPIQQDHLVASDPGPEGPRECRSEPMKAAIQAETVGSFGNPVDDLVVQAR
jgi:hypothetical protein